MKLHDMKNKSNYILVIFGPPSMYSEIQKIRGDSIEKTPTTSGPTPQKIRASDRKIDI